VDSQVEDERRQGDLSIVEPPNLKEIVAIPIAISKKPQINALDELLLEKGIMNRNEMAEFRKLLPCQHLMLINLDGFVKSPTSVRHAHGPEQSRRAALRCISCPVKLKAAISRRYGV
jgi:hypothetical protein